MASRAAIETEVVAYLRELEPDVADLALWTRGVLLETDPDLSERIYRGWRDVGYHHPEGGYVCAIYPRTEVRLLFEQGPLCRIPKDCWKEREHRPARFASPLAVRR